MYTQEQIERAARVLAAYDMYPNWDMIEDREQIHYIHMAREVARELDGGE